MSDRHVGRGRPLGSIPNDAIFSVENPGREQEWLAGRRLRKAHQEGGVVYGEGVADGRVVKLKASTRVMVVKAPLEGGWTGLTGADWRWPSDPRESGQPRRC